MAATCCLSMATSVPNPGLSQNTCCCCGDGGASGLSTALNAIGRYGTAITGIVASSQVKGACIKAKAATTVATSAINSTTMIVIVVVIAVVVFLALRK